MSAAETFSLIVTALSPIILGVLSIFQVNRDKKHQDFLKVQAENDKLRAEKENKRREAEDDRLRKMETSINEVTDTVKSLESKINEMNIETQLDHLHTITELNFSYMQSLSDTVMVIGDALTTSDTISADSRNSLNSSIEQTRQKEEKIAENLLKILS